VPKSAGTADGLNSLFNNRKSSAIALNRNAGFVVASMASAAALLIMHAAHSASTFNVFDSPTVLLLLQIHVKPYIGLSP